MRLLNKNDNETLNTIKLSFKMTGKDKMSDYFKKKAESGESGVTPQEAWFYYGLNAWEMLNATTESQKKHGYLVAALKGFAGACSGQEKHWPALFFRPLLRIMMSGDQVDEMCMYLLQDDYTIEDAENDLRELIRLQQETTPQPYFFVTHALMAHRMLEQDKPREAAQHIKSGLIDIPPGKAQTLDSLLLIPVIMVYNKLLEVKLLKLAAKVKHRHNILFPNRKIT